MVLRLDPRKILYSDCNIVCLALLFEGAHYILVMHLHRRTPQLDRLVSGFLLQR